MILNILFAFFSVFGMKSDVRPPFVFPDEIGVFLRYKTLLVNVREQTISPDEAKVEFLDILNELRRTYPNELDSSQVSDFVFPLIGSNYSAVGGKGSGFYVHKFNLFDHKISGSHPAHDIFIYDPNQDCVDDRRNEYVDIVSVGKGIVVAVEKNWADTSAYKGGNYVWVYDTERGGLWYYAHHRKVVVDPGQKVKAGDKLGEVGRTGFNAKNKRSDTHLHLMYLELDEELNPWPKNYYSWLKNARTLKGSTNAEQLRFRLLDEIKLIQSKKLSNIRVNKRALSINSKKTNFK